MVSMWVIGFWLVIGLLTLWVVLVLVGGIVFLVIFERFRVNFDQFVKEKLYISWNLEVIRSVY